DLVEQRRLQAREGEVEPRNALGGRERERLRVAIERELGERRAAGVAEPEQPRALVERLPRRVVERAAETLVRAVLGHARQQRVAARGEQAQERRLDRVGQQVIRGDVALQVVDGRQRQPARGGEALGGRDTDQQRADQARALR